MDFQIDFSRMPAYVAITTSGKASLEGFSRLLKSLTEAPEWIAGTPQLVDHRALDLSALSPMGIELIGELTQHLNDQLGNGRVAFVMQGALGILSAENYSSAGNLPHSSTRTFSSREEAIDWLLSESC